MTDVLANYLVKVAVINRYFYLQTIDTLTAIKLGMMANDASTYPYPKFSLIVSLTMTFLRCFQLQHIDDI